MRQQSARNAGATVGLQHVHAAHFSGCSVNRPQGTAADGRAGEESNEVGCPLLPWRIGGRWSAGRDELGIERASFQCGLFQERHSLGALWVYFLYDQRSAHASANPVTREEAPETRTLSLTFPRRNALRALPSLGRDTTRRRGSESLCRQESG